MTTELILLLSVFLFVIVGIFKTPTRTFEESGPKLGYRVERQIETGVEFAQKSRSYPNPINWERKK